MAGNLLACCYLSLLDWLGVGDYLLIPHGGRRREAEMRDLHLLLFFLSCWASNHVEEGQGRLYCMVWRPRDGLAPEGEMIDTVVLVLSYQNKNKCMKPPEQALWLGVAAPVDMCWMVSLNSFHWGERRWGGNLTGALLKTSEMCRIKQIVTNQFL